jgi:hypothetical protein
VLDDRASARSAQAGVNKAASQLATDQAPKGSAAEIAADQAAVRSAEEAMQQAAKRLRSDGAQAALVDVLA